VEPTGRWRELLDQRLEEAVGVLGAVPGVRGLVVGGSLGRGDPWPLSDIDLLPVYAGSFAPSREVERCHAMLVDWWAASGRAQTLDVGWLAFTDDEVGRAWRGSAAPPSWAPGWSPSPGPTRGSCAPGSSRRRCGCGSGSSSPPPPASGSASRSAPSRTPAISS
jgi:predicted nucleotidyltransferase